MSSHAKILIADDLAAIDAFRQALVAPFALTPCTTVQQAHRALEETPDVVACGCHFDEGGMYDLLRFMKATPRLAGVPFVAVRCLQGELDDTLYEGVRIAVRALGGDAFIDLLRWQRQDGEAQAAHRLTAMLTQLARSSARGCA